MNVEGEENRWKGALDATAFGIEGDRDAIIGRPKEAFCLNLFILVFHERTFSVFILPFMLFMFSACSEC